MIDEDPDHEAVLGAPGSHRVVVAPPGTGKTVLSVCVAGRLARSLPPRSRVLLLTFSNQARSQLEREARLRLSAEDRQRIEVTNYHKFFCRCVFAYRRALGLGPSPALVPPKVRRAALLAAVPEARTYLGGDAATDRVAEWQFEEFRDANTPPPEIIERLLTVVRSELENGRVVFDDLGALFWRLVKEHPAVAQAYRAHFRQVIADEHQDASALQDSFVRWLATDGLTILCDPMQLIHGYRGADLARLERHRTEGVEFALHTPHRWRDRPAAGVWLLAVRTRLEGRMSAALRPAECEIVRTADRQGINGSIVATIGAVHQSVADNCGTIAVLVATNAELATVRKRLCVAGFRPRQIGAADDLNEAYGLVERVRAATTPREITNMAVEQLVHLAPTFPTVLAEQLQGRLGDQGVNMERCGRDAAGYLERLAPIYEHGSSAYFKVMAALLAHAAAKGLALPRTDFCRLIEAVAHSPNDAESMVNGELAGILITRSTNLDHGLFIMTTHQAKGREFDSVVLCHALERHYPAEDVAGRNLFYVAITRGIRRWYVIAPSGDMTRLVRTLG